MKVCAIVDAYSSGSLLAPAFADRGYKAIHVRSTDRVPYILSHTFRKQDFYLDIPARSVETQAAALAEQGVEVIIAGTDSGVELTDRLNEKLGLPGNGTKMSAARRDKFEMVDVIRKAGLRTARQVKASSVEDAISLAASLPRYDVILKPLRSAGTDLVLRAQNEQEIRAAFRKITSQTTLFGEWNNAVCVQEFLVGEEFVVDMVLRNGDPVITDMWQYHLGHANGVPYLYDNDELLRFDDPRTAQLKPYAIDIVHALGMRWGPVHPEIMLTAEGPVVIEVNSRLPGILPPCVKAAAGKSPAAVVSDAYCDPGAFLRDHAPYELEKYCLVVHLIAHESGIFKAISRMSEIEELPSFHHDDVWAIPGKPIYKTIDLATSPGFLCLMHNDRAVVERDYQFIRQLENGGLYELAA